VSRTALVTGAAGGIGIAIVDRLERDDWNVHAVAVRDGHLATREGKAGADASSQSPPRTL
jgi:NAD(P)-dependent dehydrogenase (short-subunit alcohol dehydrogenase family)